MAVETKSTTLTLPSELMDQLERAIDAGEIASRDAFVADAIRHEFAAIERASVDAAFAEMASDEDYQAEIERLTQAFSEADVEAWRLAESS